MFIQWVTGLSRLGGGQEREYAVEQQSGCPAPGFGVKGIEYRSRSLDLEHIDGSRALKVTVRADHPGGGSGFPPDQSSAGKHVLEVDEQRRGGRARSFLAIHPARRLRSVDLHDVGQTGPAEYGDQVAHA